MSALLRRKARLFAARLAETGLVTAAWFLPLSIAGAQLGMTVMLAGVGMAWLAGARGFGPREVILPAAAFITASLVATLGAPVPVPSEGWLVTRHALLVLLVPSVLSLSADPARAARRALIALLTAAFLGALLGLYQRSTGFDLNHALGLRRLPIRVPAPAGEKFSALGTLNSRLTFASIEAAVLVLALALSVAGRSLKVRVASAIVAVAAGAAVTATFARAAWIGALLGIAVLATGLRRRAALVLLGVAIVGGSAAALVPAVRARAVSAVKTTANPDRLFMWSRAGEVLADHPGVGVGSYAYPIVARPYYDRHDPHFPMRTWAHDMYFSALLETGIAGLVAYLWIFVSVFAVGLRRLRVEPGGDARAVRLGALGATASLLGWSLFHDLLYDGEAAMLLFFVAGLAVSTLSREHAKGEVARAPASSGPGP